MGIGVEHLLVAERLTGPLGITRDRHVPAVRHDFEDVPHGTSCDAGRPGRDSSPRGARAGTLADLGHDLLGERTEDRLPLDEPLTGVLRQDDDPRDLRHGHHAAHLLAYFLGRAGQRHHVDEAIGHQLAVTRGGRRVLVGVVGGADPVRPRPRPPAPARRAGDAASPMPRGPARDPARACGHDRRPSASTARSRDRRSRPPRPTAPRSMH